MFDVANILVQLWVRLMMMLLYSVKCERNGALNLFEMQINVAPHFYTQIRNAFFAHIAAE